MSREILRDALTALGSEAARQQDAALGNAVAPGARERFERALEARRMGSERAAPRRTAAARTWPGRRIVAAAFTLAVAAAAIGLLVRSRELSFSVAEEKGHVGDWIVASEELPLRFSDGTSLTLEGDSFARVTSLSANGADVVIPRGHVRASVVHSAGSHWKLDVGAFVVHVTGTRFDAGWDPQTQLFTLDLHEGSVVVTGCAMEPQPVRAGTSVRARCKLGQGNFDAQAMGTPRSESDAGATVAELHDAGASADAEAHAVALPPAATPATPPPPAPTTPPPAPTASANGPTAPSWRELAASGRNREALAAVLESFDTECLRGSAADVMALADVARYAGDIRHARGALLAARTRFHGSTQATAAAFLLGRMAFDAGQFADAGQWFQTASSEEPNGALSREAVGRLIEAREKSGDHAGARAAAQRYLQRYPSGPHASLAIQVLGP